MDLWSAEIASSVGVNGLISLVHGNSSLGKEGRAMYSVGRLRGRRLGFWSGRL